jgi:hypothetical protein
MALDACAVLDRVDPVRHQVIFTITACLTGDPEYRDPSILVPGLGHKQGSINRGQIPVIANIQSSKKCQKWGLTPFYYIDYDRPDNRLRFDNAVLNRPLTSANPELARINDQTVLDYLARFDRASIAMQVREIMGSDPFFPPLFSAGYCHSSHPYPS